MRILAIHHTSSLGGGSTSFLDILSMLKDRHEVVVCCPTGTTELPELIGNLGISMVANPAPFPTFDHYEGAPSPLSNRLMKPYRRRRRHRATWTAFVKAQNCDLVLVNSSTLAPLQESFDDAGIPSLVFVRETIPAPRRSPRSRLLYRAISEFDTAVYISSFDRDQAAAYVDRPSTVVGDSFKQSSFRLLNRDDALRNLGLEGDRFSVLFTGGALWYKGLDVLLDAATRLASDDARLLIAGYPLPVDSGAKRYLRALSPRRSDRFIRRVRRIMKRPGMKERVAFLGPLSDMSAAYSAADAVAFPAQVPHQSRPLFEASMYSLPIIISDFMQYREHLVSGFFVGPRDSRAVAQAIDSLRLDRKLRVSMAAANREQALSLHGYDTEKQKLLDLVAKFEQPST